MDQPPATATTHPAPEPQTSGLSDGEVWALVAGGILAALAILWIIDRLYGDTTRK